MAHPISRCGLVAALAVLMGAFAGTTLPARAARTAHVIVSIKVDPTAEISFPKGNAFTIFVPPRDCGYHHEYHHHEFGQHDCVDWRPRIMPIRIPFVVMGNASAIVSARPDSYLRIRSGPYLGEAVSHDGDAIAYQLILQFPCPTESYHWLTGWPDSYDWKVQYKWPGFGYLPTWSRIAALPGLDGASTNALTGSLSAHRGKAYGVIYVIAKRDWTSSGTPAAPGPYFGSIEITVSAAEP